MSTSLKALLPSAQALTPGEKQLSCAAAVRAGCWRLRTDLFFSVVHSVAVFSGAAFHLFAVTVSTGVCVRVRKASAALVFKKNCAHVPLMAHVVSRFHTAVIFSLLVF